MGWSIGYDENWKRDIGYGVPAICDHPDCDEEIDRGLRHVCGSEPYGGDEGCGLFFCGVHLGCVGRLCERCTAGKKPFLAKPDHPDWIEWKITDESWKEWREENPLEVFRMQERLDAIRAAAATGESKRADAQG
jgi:hypothetical protein